MTRITGLRLGCVTYDRGRALVRFVGQVFRFAALIACIECEEGIRGLGIGWARLDDELGYARAGLSELRETLIGRDARSPFETSRLVQERGAHLGVTRISCAVELALWDLAGWLGDAPVCDLLGRKSKSLPAYAISAKEFSFTAIEQYVELVADFQSRGFRACKLHLFGDPQRDIETCRAIRTAVGDGMILMLDPAGRYRAEQALRVGHAIEELGFIRIEDPLSPGDRAGYRWLSGRIDVPIAVDASAHWSTTECLDAIRRGSMQCLRMDPGLVGITRTLHMAAVAEATGIEFDTKAFAPCGGVEAPLHVALAASTARWFEHYDADGLDKVPGVGCGTHIAAGMAVPANSPGFGAEVDWPELDRHCVWA